MFVRVFVRFLTIFAITMLLTTHFFSLCLVAGAIIETPGESPAGLLATMSAVSSFDDSVIKHLSAWLLGKEKLSAVLVEGVFMSPQSFAWGQTASGGRWLLICQPGRISEKLQLVQMRVKHDLDPAMLSYGITEFLCMVEERRMTDRIFSAAFLWLQDISENERQEILVSMIGQTPSQIMALHYGEQRLRFTASSDVAIEVVARTAAELGFAADLDPWASLGIDGQQIDFENMDATHFVLSGGEHILFDLTLRLLYRLDGQELPEEAQGLSFSFGGQVVQLNAVQRFWLPFWAVGGCLLALLWVHYLYRGSALLWAVPAPLITLAIGFVCRGIEAVRFADICFLWLSCAAPLLALPIHMRRLLCVVQGLLMLPIVEAFRDTALPRLELLILWLLLQLLWGIAFYLYPNRLRS